MGACWHNSQDFADWHASNLFTSPVSMFLNVKGMQAGFMSFCALMLLTRGAGLAAGWWLHSEFASIAAYTMASVAVMLPFLGYVVRSAQGSMWKIIRKSLPPS